MSGGSIAKLHSLPSGLTAGVRRVARRDFNSEHQLNNRAQKGWGGVGRRKCQSLLPLQPGPPVGSH